MKKVDKVLSMNSKINKLYENKFPILITIGFFLTMFYVAFYHHPIWTEIDGIYYLNFGKAILDGNGKDVTITIPDTTMTLITTAQFATQGSHITNVIALG